jgi:hypothetical protein
MVENTNSTILKVQGSFGLTYMVGIIPLNLRSQEMDKGVPHAHARAAVGRAGLERGVAWRGVTRRGEARQTGAFSCPSLRQPHARPLSFSCPSSGVPHVTLLLQLPSARG